MWFAASQLLGIREVTSCCCCYCPLCAQRAMRGTGWSRETCNRLRLDWNGLSSAAAVKAPPLIERRKVRSSTSNQKFGRRAANRATGGAMKSTSIVTVIIHLHRRHRHHLLHSQNAGSEIARPLKITRLTSEQLRVNRLSVLSERQWRASTPRRLQ